MTIRIGMLMIQAQGVFKCELGDYIQGLLQVYYLEDCKAYKVFLGV